MTMQELFAQTLTVDSSSYRTLWFNLYEDPHAFTMEAAFDEETAVIGRDNPADFCGKAAGWEAALEQADALIRAFCDAHAADLQHLTEIAYGFVDGDLIYLRKAETPKTVRTERFTAEDFADFNIVKLHAWIRVYVDREVQKQLPLPLFPPMDASAAEVQRYREFLAEHMDLEKYNTMKEDA